MQAEAVRKPARLRHHTQFAPVNVQHTQLAAFGEYD